MVLDYVSDFIYILDIFIKMHEGLFVCEGIVLVHPSGRRSRGWGWCCSPSSQIGGWRCGPCRWDMLFFRLFTYKSYKDAFRRGGGVKGSITHLEKKERKNMEKRVKGSRRMGNKKSQKWTKMSGILKWFQVCCPDPTLNNYVSPPPLPPSWITTRIPLSVSFSNSLSRSLTLCLVL